MRSQAASADLQPYGHSADVDRLVLDVRLERPVSAGRLALPPSGVLVSDVAPERRALGADVTFGHWEYLYSLISSG